MFARTRIAAVYRSVRFVLYRTLERCRLNAHATHVGSAVLSDTVPEFFDERIGMVFAHWLAARHGQLVPRRDQISPAAIPACLPYVWIYRWLPEERSFRNVLAGEEINLAWSFSIRGKSMEELFGSDADKLRQRWIELLERPAISYGRLTSELSQGRYKRAERLNLPLLDNDAKPYGILGITIYDFDRLHAEQTEIPPPLAVVMVPCAALPGAPAGSG
jgi:hypothetical protein